jgi:hypothetical protein
MSEIQLLMLAGFIFVGVPILVLVGAYVGSLFDRTD